MSRSRLEISDQKVAQPQAPSSNAPPTAWHARHNGPRFGVTARLLGTNQDFRSLQDFGSLSARSLPLRSGCATQGMGHIAEATGPRKRKKPETRLLERNRVSGPLPLSPA